MHFFARIYVKAWINAPLAVSAPQNDLHLLQSLLEYRSIHAGISTVTSKKMAGHLWYLSEQLVNLALFDDNVSNDVKEKMVLAMEQVDGDKEPPKRRKLCIDNLMGKNVSDYCSKNSRGLFRMLDLPQDFLEIPVSEWNGSPQYLNAKKAAMALAVTNDHAERGVALIENLSGKLTKDEEQLQFLLQCVAEHRKRFPLPLKRTLLGQP